MASDNFTGAGGTLLATYNSDWADAATGYAVSGWQIQSDGSGIETNADEDAFGARNTASTQAVSEIVLESGVSGSNIELFARCDGTNEGYRARFQISTGTITTIILYRDQTYIGESSVSYATSADRTLRIDATDTGSITVSIDGAQELSVDDSATPITRTGNPGLGAGVALGEVVSIASWNDGATGDTTAPTLTSPTASATGTTTASGSVSTDEGNGTIDAVLTTSATPPSAAQVQAGQDHTGSSAVATDLDNIVTATGSQSFTFSGLQTGVRYWMHVVHEDASANVSSVASSDPFSLGGETSTVTTRLIIGN